MAVALYARVSTAKQAEKDLSIPDQLRQMRDWCKSAGFTVAQEYIEPGASATDDRRPAFQQMIADALLTPPPFEAVIVHSLSRFFRDSLEFGLYERRLHKAGVKVISITQQTGDDPAGEMARKIFSLFDEYQSKENGKHTLRAMQENARQGFFNGSRPPFGYQALETEATGNKGKKKKRLVIHEAEAETVRRIYRLYQDGEGSGPKGIKDIATTLNRQGITMRGKPWRNQKVHQILSNSAYCGTAYFNRTNVRQQRRKPEAEWIAIPVPAIVERGAFEAVREARSARAPAKTPPRLASSPALLTGLLRCGCCGSGMTLTTGKSGRYRYYKCTSKHSKAVFLCSAPNLPMEQTDDLVRQRLAEQVFTPTRVERMLKELGSRFRRSKSEEQQKLDALQRQLQALKEKQDRLYEAVENGFLPMDESLQQRAHKLKAEREAVLTEMAGLRRKQAMPLDRITPKQVEAFAQALHTHLLNKDSGFGKAYLRLLVEEIRIEGKQATIKGSYAVLAGAVNQSKPETKKGTSTVPSFIPDWRPQGGSNPCYRRERAVS